MRVLLKQPAFLSIVLAAVETFKKECFGYILGKTDDKGFVAEHSIPMQTAKRKYNSVENIDNRQKIVTAICGLFWKSSQIIGDFHSHPRFQSNDRRDMSSPSDSDAHDSKEGHVYFIAVIEQKKKRQRWKVTKDGGISGTLGDFKIKIRAFYAPQDRTLEPIKISCPTIYKLNALKELDNRIQTRYT